MWLRGETEKMQRPHGAFSVLAVFSSDDSIWLGMKDDSGEGCFEQLSMISVVVCGKCLVLGQADAIGCVLLLY